MKTIAPCYLDVEQIASADPEAMSLSRNDYLRVLRPRFRGYVSDMPLGSNSASGCHLLLSSEKYATHSAEIKELDKKLKIQSKHHEVHRQYFCLNYQILLVLN